MIFACDPFRQTRHGTFGPSGCRRNAGRENGRCACGDGCGSVQTRRFVRILTASRVALRYRFGVLPLIASVWGCCRRSGSPIPKEARMSKDYNRLDKNNAAVLMVDHQAGLLSLVRDIEPDKFKNNVLALADLAAYFKLPTILTTSFEEGPNGPLMPELKEKFPKAPFIPRPGQINAWDNEDFVKAVKATGKRQLIIAGIVTEVCVAFPVLSALAEGYEVF